MIENNKQQIKALVTKVGRHLLICGVSILCWWGLFMPQLLLNKDTIRVVTADESFEYHMEDYDMYMEILQADKEQVVFKSKLLEYLKEAGILQQGADNSN